MSRSFNRWRPSHLLGAWVVYWLGLAAVSVRDVVSAGFRATQSGGSITGGLSNSELGITVAQQAGETVKWAVPVSAVSAWVVIPPMVLWAVWLVSRKRAAADERRDLAAGAPRGGWQEVGAPLAHDATKPRTPVP
jgi:hypothetical protein